MLFGARRSFKFSNGPRTLLYNTVNFKKIFDVVMIFNVFFFFGKDNFGAKAVLFH